MQSPGVSADVAAMPAVQNDFDKLRRLPWYYAQVMLTNTAVLCTISAPLALFAAELGLGEDRIGLLGGVMPFIQVAGLAALPLIARFGSRKVATWSFLARYSFLCLFFATPLFLGQPDVVFAFLLVGMLGFSIMRAFAEAALIPWSQEFVPRAMRGRISGRIALLSVPAALVVSWLIRSWLDGQEGLGRFYPVFAVGIAAGMIGALLLLRLRGGAPTAMTERPRVSALIEPLGDRNYLIFLTSSAVQYMLLMALNVFAIIYFRELGLSAGEIVFLAALTQPGAALGTFAAGWLVDRYGARPVFLALMVGQIAVLLFMPMIPPGAAGLLWIAGAVFFIKGVFLHSAMAVGQVYMLNIVPPSMKEAYTTLHYITVGLVGGSATVLSGVLLATLREAPLVIAGQVIAPFTVLFVLGAALSVVAGTAFYFLREEGGLSVRDFLLNFSTGAPFRALIGIQRYRGETSEERRRDLAYSFGALGSPLAKAELIEALRDPSFSVRNEAVQALGRMAPHDDVIEALRRVLGFDGLVELQYSALAALGRLKARVAAPDAATFLDSDNPLLRARAIRSLGEMGSVSDLDRIRAVLSEVDDLDSRLAAVSAIGTLQDRASLPALVAFYRERILDRAVMAEPRAKVVLLAISKILQVEESFAFDWQREQNSPGQGVPDLMERMARALRRAPGTQADEVAGALRFGADSYEPEAAGPALAAALAMRPLVAARGGPEAEAALVLMDGVADITEPHPALVILVLLAARRSLRR